VQGLEEHGTHLEGEAYDDDRVGRCPGVLGPVKLAKRSNHQAVQCAQEKEKDEVELKQALVFVAEFVLPFLSREVDFVDQSRELTRVEHAQQFVFAVEHLDVVNAWPIDRVDLNSIKHNLSCRVLVGPCAIDRQLDFHGCACQLFVILAGRTFHRLQLLVVLVFENANLDQHVLRSNAVRQACSILQFRAHNHLHGGVASYTKLAAVLVRHLAHEPVFTRYSLRFYYCLSQDQ